MSSRLYTLGICRQVTPCANVMKLGTVVGVGYLIALTAVGPHRLTGFGVSRHQSWVPSIDKAHRAYYTAIPATAGTHDVSIENRPMEVRGLHAVLVRLQSWHCCICSRCSRLFIITSRVGAFFFSSNFERTWKQAATSAHLSSNKPPVAALQGRIEKNTICQPTCRPPPDSPKCHPRHSEHIFFGRLYIARVVSSRHRRAQKIVNEIAYFCLRLTLFLDDTDDVIATHDKERYAVLDKQCHGQCVLLFDCYKRTCKPSVFVCTMCINNA